MFEKLTGEVQGPLDVRSSVSVDGTLHGGAVVTGQLELRGIVNGPLEVRLDGQADVIAVVHGDVHARGGTLTFRGIINGKLGIKPGAEVLMGAGSVLNGRRLEADGSWTPVDPGYEFKVDDDTAMLSPTDDGNWVPVG